MSKLSSGTVQIILTDDEGVKSSEVGVKMANDINAGNNYKCLSVFVLFTVHFCLQNANEILSDKCIHVIHLRSQIGRFTFQNWENDETKKEILDFK